MTISKKEKDDANVTILIELERMFDILHRLYQSRDEQNKKAYVFAIEKDFRDRLLSAE